MGIFNEEKLHKGLLELDRRVSRINTVRCLDEEKRVVLNRAYADFYDYVIKYAGIDFDNITTSIADKLNMKRLENDLYLFPLWLLPIIPEGLEVETVNGDIIYFKMSECYPRISNNGYTYFGLRIKDDKINNIIVDCERCIHKKVCGYKNKNMRELKDRIGYAMNGTMAEESPMVVKLECKSFVDINNRILTR